jgi:LysM repeat protein
MTYIVQKGDTIGKIAEQFGVSIDTIKVANRLSKDLLTPGKELVILPVSGVYYTVKKGDTLGRIASLYKISVSTILEYNGINEKYIKVGDKIILPGAKAVAETSKTTSATQITTTGVSTGYYIYPTTG